MDLQRPEGQKEDVIMTVVGDGWSKLGSPLQQPAATSMKARPAAQLHPPQAAPTPPAVCTETCIPAPAEFCGVCAVPLSAALEGPTSTVGGPQTAPTSVDGRSLPPSPSSFPLENTVNTSSSNSNFRHQCTRGLFIRIPQEYTGCILTTSKYLEPLVLADQERPHSPPGPLYPEACLKATALWTTPGA